MAKTWPIPIVLILTFFLTLSAIISHGILALPVELGRTGFLPFFMTFWIPLAAQFFMIPYLIEVICQVFVDRRIETGAYRKDEELDSHGGGVRVEKEGEDDGDDGEKKLLDGEKSSDDVSGESDKSEESEEIIIQDDVVVVDDGDDDIIIQTKDGMEDKDDEDGKIIVGENEMVSKIEDVAGNNNNNNIVIGEDEKSVEEMLLKDFKGDDIDAYRKEEKVVVRRQQEVKLKEKNINWSIDVDGIDFHLIGKHFLHPVILVLYEIVLLVNFCCFLAAYGLTGPQLLGILFGIEDYFVYLITPFILVITVIIIIFHMWIVPIISVLTFFKGLVIVAFVAFVGTVSIEHHVQYQTDFRFILRPFLLETAVVCGATNIVPLVFTRLNKENPFYLKVFCYTILVSLFFVWTVDITWAYIVLNFVPQEHLVSAYNTGRMVVDPLETVIMTYYPSLVWIERFTTFLVLFSSVVSFITVSSALKHMLDGYVKSFLNSNFRVGSLAHRLRNLKFSESILALLIYAVVFGGICIAAQVNPESYELILDIFGSFTANCRNIFFVYIFIKARKIKKSKYPMPFRVPTFMALCSVFIFGFYLFVLVFDFVYNSLRFFFDPVPF